MSFLRRLVLLFAFMASVVAVVPAQAADDAAMVVHLLDYVAVDYGGAVQDGKIVSADEYKEMQEFSAQILARMQALPPNASRESLADDARKLGTLIGARASVATVADAANRLRWSLIAAYKIQVAPRLAPSLAKAQALYAQHCAACHGATGHGDGPAAKGLDPAPADFHDAERMASRSTYGLYNTISLGVQGTSMSAYAQLSEDERWALAFHAANLGVPAGRVKQGEALWKAGAASLASQFPDLAALVSLSSNEVKERHGENAVAVQDYLRTHPEALAAGRPLPIALARTHLTNMLAAYAKGDRQNATRLAISAYLDGFELAESSLDTVDRELRLDIEREMMPLRAMLGAGAAVDEVRRQTARVDALLEAADAKLSGGELSSTTAFVGSLVILLREGLEAILILAAIIAFVTRAGRREAMLWVHAGWMAALVLGALTWIAATWLIEISGANREITEGMTALIAAVTLLYVGWWLHARTHAKAWNTFLREQVSMALEKKTLWALASVSFLAVYREMFEVVLFYQALWVQAGQGGQNAVLGGIAVALLMLAVAGWLIFRYSLRLPLGPFFAGMTVLLVVLAVVFAGQGISALQEAGVVGVQQVGFVSIPMLGVHPTAQTLGAQLLVLILVGLGYWRSAVKAAR
jgi:high-affinity iron transporter